MSRGRRYDETPKLNIKKVIATIVAFVVFVMVIISLKNLLTNTTPKTKDVSAAKTYFGTYTNSKWGVIDNNGGTIIDNTYDEMIVIPDENKDLFICTYNENYENETFNTKVLNSQGKEILTAYNQVQAIENTDGTDIWYENNILKFEKNGKYGLINFEGKQILNAEYDNIYALEGIQKNIIIEKNGLKGLLNTSMGEIIIEPKYTDIETLTDTYENGYIVSEDGKYGIINADSKIVFNTVYEDIEHVTSDGEYVVKIDNSVKLVDSEGKTILDSGFDEIKEINGDNLTIQLKDKYGVIQKDGTVVIENKYDDLKYLYGTYYIAQKDGKYGVISTDGEEKVDFSYHYMEYIKKADFIQAENENYKTDIINRDFEVVLSDIIISELNLENGYIRVREDDNYNYYNFKFEKKTSQEVLTTSTLFLIKENGKYGYENKNGEKIVDCIYDDAKEQNKFGYCAVKKDGVWGALKSDGTVIVPPSINLDDYLYIDFIGTWHLNKDLNLNIYTK